MNEDLKTNNITTTQNCLHARKIALTIYEKVLKDRNFIEDNLSSTLYNQLNSQNKSFVRNLVSSSFRVKFKVDYILDKFINNKTNQTVKSILSLACTEIIVLKTPEYAVVNSYVEMCKSIGLSKLSGLINAVLKKVCLNYQNILSEYDYNNNWLFKIWSKEYSKEEAKRICQALENRSPLDLVFINSSSMEKSKHLGDVIFDNVLRIYQSINVTDISGFNEGDFWVQGASSFIAISTIKEDVENAVVADLCCAPGGKTFLLNHLGVEKIKAFDVSAKRLQIMQSNCKRLNIKFISNSVCEKLQDSEENLKNTKVILDQENILKITKEKLQGVKLVVLDVPCMATGTIRKHPEVMYVKTLSQLNEIQQIQKEMLNHVASNIENGSIIMYSNCSIQKAEGENIINKFLQENDNFKLIPFTKDNVFNHQEFLTKEGYLRILPYHLEEQGGMEGFFAARMIKIA